MGIIPHKKGGKHKNLFQIKKGRRWGRRVMSYVGMGVVGSRPTSYFGIATIMLEKDIGRDPMTPIPTYLFYLEQIFVQYHHPNKKIR